MIWYDTQVERENQYFFLNSPFNFSCSLVFSQTLAMRWASVRTDGMNDATTHSKHVFVSGIYHSGIEIGEHEYCFGGHDYENVTGVFMVQPKVGPQGLLFK